MNRKMETGTGRKVREALRQGRGEGDRNREHEREEPPAGR